MRSQQKNVDGGRWLGPAEAIRVIDRQPRHALQMPLIGREPSSSRPRDMQQHALTSTVHEVQGKVLGTFSPPSPDHRLSPTTSTTQPRCAILSYSPPHSTFPPPPLPPHNKLFAATRLNAYTLNLRLSFFRHPPTHTRPDTTMHLPPTPEPRDLLPPLLACLPTTFVSPRPPPALLPLLAPVLRQRASLLVAGNASEEGWIRSLNWDPERAAKLRPIIDQLELEPHPVSGEIELDDVDSIKYRRLDDETLQARLDAEQFDLAPIYVWCETDEHGGTGPGWKLTELRALEDVEDGTAWFNSVTEANDAANTHSIAVPSASSTTAPAQQSAQGQTDDKEDDSDDDGYWAAYDQTPGPSQKPSPKPPANAAAPESANATRDRSRSELEYFARYGSEVQPALDAHDPDEDHPELGQSTLNGTTQRAATSTAPQEPLPAQGDAQEDNRAAWEKALHPYARPANAHDSAFATSTDLPSTQDLDITAPRPISPTSSHSSVEHLESRAAEMSQRPHSHVENAVRQHISTEIKSLWRLASGAGLDRDEFERVVGLEVQCIGLMDRDE